MGNLLYKLVEGKENMKDISKGFVKGRWKFSSSYGPHEYHAFLWPLSIASVIGAKALNDLRNNKFIKGGKKVTIISDILARSGAKSRSHYWRCSSRPDLDTYSLPRSLHWRGSGRLYCFSYGVIIRFPYCKEDIFGAVSVSFA
jgi:hypothetical protein